MKVTYIEFLGEKHPLCFSLAASAQLDEAFGGLENMGKMLETGSVGQRVKAIDQVLDILMQAGRTYAAARGDELPEPLPCRPGDLIDVRDGSAVQSILSAISNGTQREVEAKPKNEEATQAP